MQVLKTLGAIMELQLAKYRKLAGFKSRDAFAEYIGVNTLIVLGNLAQR